MKKHLLFLFLFISSLANAQVGEHRNDFAVGGNAGYILSNVSFVPSVPQGFHGGITGGLSFRYTCEKYFKSICAIYAEVNYSQIGWKEEILDKEENPVINPQTEQEEQFQKTINYIQIPVMAHMGWGRERSGYQFFVNIGPQFGVYLSESIKANYDILQPNWTKRVSPVIAQDTMKVENKFDYGIAAGIGLEYSHRKLGHFIIEGRYYFGLGNIYGDSKRDYFARSNYGNIVFKLTYLFDLIRTQNDKIK
ncbi:MAG: PorT family protein [Prevotella sp.]|nr:PorT family protein [Prevotella sp.]